MSSKFRGFTLTELLISMAILSGLIVLLFSVVDGTTKTWNQSEQRVDAFREARAALFIIARDLRSAVPASDVGPEPYPTPTPVPPALPVPTPTPSPIPTPNGVPDFKYFFINPPTTGANGTDDVSFSSVAPSGGFGLASDVYADRLFFMTSQSLNAQPTNAQPNGPATPAKGDLCLVGYYLKYTQPVNAASSGAKAFNLYRYFRNSDDSYNVLKDYVTGTSKTLMAPRTEDDVLARNVVDFRITAYDENLKALNIITADFGKIMPYAVDVSITAYNYSVANRLNSQNSWINFRKNNPSKDELSRQTFSTRVYLPRKGPTPTPAP